MEYTIKQLSDLAGITPRTLRWYDSQGLLKPGRVTEAGYRLYGPAEVDRLQQILFYRALDLPLPEIRTLLGRRCRATCRPWKRGVPSWMPSS